MDDEEADDGPHVKHMDSNVDTLTEEEVEELEAAFKQVAKDGRLRATDLGRVIAALGHEPEAEELQDMIEELEAMGSDDGTIGFSEFCSLMARGNEGADQENHLIDTFDVFDCNQNGLISAQELKMVMEAFGQILSKEEVAEMIREMDINGDGQIDYEEFNKAIANGAQSNLSIHWRTVVDLTHGKSAHSAPCTPEVEIPDEIPEVEQTGKKEPLTLSESRRVSLDAPIDDRPGEEVPGAVPSATPAQSTTSPKSLTFSPLPRNSITGDLLPADVMSPHGNHLPADIITPNEEPKRMVATFSVQAEPRGVRSVSEIEIPEDGGGQVSSQRIEEVVKPPDVEEVGDKEKAAEVVPEKIVVDLETEAPKKIPDDLISNNSVNSGFSSFREFLARGDEARKNIVQVWIGRKDPPPEITTGSGATDKESKSEKEQDLQADSRSGLFGAGSFFSFTMSPKKNEPLHQRKDARKSSAGLLLEQAFANQRRRKITAASDVPQGNT